MVLLLLQVALLGLEQPPGCPTAQHLDKMARFEADVDCGQVGLMHLRPAGCIPSSAPPPVS